MNYVDFEHLLDYADVHLEARQELHVEKLLLALYAEEIIPTKLSISREEEHRQFARSLLSFPDTGVILKRVPRTTTITGYFNRMAELGYFDAEQEGPYNKRLLTPTDHFKQLISITEPTDKDFIAS